MDPARESVTVYGYDRSSVQNVVGVPVLKTSVQFSGKSLEFSHSKHELINFARS